MLHTIQSPVRIQRITRDRMAQRPNRQGVIKLLIIGDSGVGKSCLLLRYSDNSFTTSFIATIGIDFKMKPVKIDGRTYRVQIWDTAGQERFKTITTAYYKGAVGCLLVYDVCDRKSFDHIKNWSIALNKDAAKNICRILVGNKSDCEDGERMVEKEEGQSLAADFGIPFFECSAKSNIMVTETFITLIRNVILEFDLADSTAPDDASAAASNGHASSGCC